MTTSTVPMFTIGQQLTLATGSVVTVVDVQAPPLPSIYVRNADGLVWQDSPRGMASRLAATPFQGWSTPGVAL
jgi:hypothetical protein